MNKLSFSQKNDLVVKHKAKKHFGKDMELFQKHLPSDRLKEITNVTQNIRRIKSNINKQKYKDENEKQSWKKNLSQAETREAVLKEIIGK